MQVSNAIASLKPSSLPCALARRSKMSTLFISCFVALTATLTSNPAYSADSQQGELPIYAAYLSDDLLKKCETKACQINVYDNQALQQIGSELAGAIDLSNALAMSEYEVLIGTAIIDLDTNPQMVFEITTTWREIPLNDMVINKTTGHDTLALASDNTAIASSILGEWLKYIIVQLLS